MGEIIVHAFSWKVAIDIGQLETEPTKKIRPTADFVALLRCPLFLLTNFVRDLYDDSNIKTKDTRSE